MLENAIQREQTLEYRVISVRRDTSSHLELTLTMIGWNNIAAVFIDCDEQKEVILTGLSVNRAFPVTNTA